MKLLVFAFLIFFGAQSSAAPSPIFDLFGSIIEGVTDIVKKIQNDIEKLAQNILNDLMKALDTVAKTVVDTSNKINQQIRTSFNELGRIVREINDKVIKAAADELRSAIANSIEQTQKAVSELSASASTAFNNFRKDIQTNIDSSTAKITQATVKLLGDIKDAVRNGIKTARECSTKYEPLITDLSKNSIEKLRECAKTTEDVGKEIFTNVTSIINDVPAVAKKIQDETQKCIQSERETAVKCLGALTKTTIDELANEIKKIANMTTEATTAFLDAMVHMITCTTNQVKDGIKEAAKLGSEIRTCLNP